MNGEMCVIIKKVKEANEDIESFYASPESYKLEKDTFIKFFSSPVTKKKIPELSRNERIKKHLEYLKEHEQL